MRPRRARRAADARVPVPDADLMARVTASRDAEWFRRSGERTVADWNAALATVGARLQGPGRILDFGCGCGRAERWLRDLAEASELHGVDVDSEAIRWAAAKLPWGHFVAGPEWPPLPYPDDHFELVVNHSVFSHLDEPAQDAWLLELARVAAPGAHVLLSVHGAHAFSEFCRVWAQHGREVSALESLYARRGFVWIADDGMSRPFPDYYHTAFHAERYLRARWGQFFDVRKIVERGALGYQDVVILQAAPGLRSAHS